jgi:broad specificity phosphatase PhoE
VVIASAPNSTHFGAPSDANCVENDREAMTTAGRVVVSGQSGQLTPRFVSMLILVRHGQTEANAQGLLLGRLDAELNERGRRQAAALAVALPRPDRVIASPLRRARDTAAAFGRPVEVDERWIELDYGELDGRPIAALGDAVWRTWRADVAFAPSGGESLAALGRRVRAACDDLAEEAASGEVVVVSHVSPIKAAIAWALGVGDEIAWRMYVADGAVARIGFGPAGPSLRSFNERYGPDGEP